MGPMGKGVIYGAGFLGFGARVLPHCLKGEGLQGFRVLGTGRARSSQLHNICRVCACVCVYMCK